MFCEFRSRKSFYYKEEKNTDMMFSFMLINKMY